MSELYHHGIKGQKWGIRRYQNKDGSLTDAGKKRVYKTVKKYYKNKRDSLGKAVGEDYIITDAARKLYQSEANTKLKEASKRRSDLSSKIEKEYEDNDGKISAKSKKEMERAISQDEKAYSDYKKEGKRIVDEYLGKYADKKIRNTDITAGELLFIQMNWGIKLGKLDKT